MESVRINEIILHGIKLPGKTTNEDGQSTIDCGKLWTEFEQRNIAGKIEGDPSRLYAVYYEYEGDHTRPFSYFIGCEVAKGTAVPEGLNQLSVPADNYLKLTAKGKMPDCVQQAWRDIWRSNYNRAFHFDFEVYDARSIDWQKAEVDIYLSVND